MPYVAMPFVEYIQQAYFPYVHIFRNTLTAVSAHICAPLYYFAIPFAGRGKPFLSWNSKVTIPIRVFVFLLAIPN